MPVSVPFSPLYPNSVTVSTHYSWFPWWSDSESLPAVAGHLGFDPRLGRPHWKEMATLHSLPGECHGQRLMGSESMGLQRRLDTTERPSLGAGDPWGASGERPVLKFCVQKPQEAGLTPGAGRPPEEGTAFILFFFF